MYHKLVANVDAIDTSGLALKTQYNTGKSDLEKKINDADKKIPDISRLAKKTNYYARITEIEGKILSITGLASNPALAAVKNKIPDVSKNKIDFVQKY